MKYYIQHYMAMRFRLVVFKEGSKVYTHYDYTPLTNSLEVDTYSMSSFRQAHAEEITEDEYNFILKRTLAMASRPQSAIY